MVLNIWSTAVDSEGVANALTINGKAWPYTERIDATVGDTIHWRVVNGTRRVHPMHLHGFYFRLDAEGDGLRELPFPGTERPLQVTQSMSPLATMGMTWVPNRPGNWLFHCHIGYHVTPGARLEHTLTAAHDRMDQSPMIHMAGLVMGITVRPRPGAALPIRGKARRLHLFVQEGRRTGLAPRAMRYVLQRDARSPAPDSIEAMSSVLVLHRDEPTDIVVVNRLTEAVAIHWHGIELESYSDGVAGWSGSGSQLAPSIAPGDSFVAHLTLPRSGTFIYHTHMNDIEQLTSGLYGGIVVLEPGKRLDPRRDHLYVLGWDGEKPRLVVNGDSVSTPLTLQAGVPHRLRFVNIGAGGRFRYSLYRDTTVAEWRLLARDGADLPAALAVRQPAHERIDVGETRDVEFLPSPGVYRLAIELPRGAVWTQEIRAIP
jgi:FtsP/CotA-like multicopper oxidase with cupredoxin domain